ncbi:MAG: hypothetical protein JXR97_15715 [Planctomycetes bacterium]|nr:hypothetical protein [Planctomycetota bacterium]
MKKALHLSLVLTTLILLNPLTMVLGSRCLAEETPPMEVMEMSTPPVIDGKLDEWNESSKMSLTPPKWMSKQDLSAVISVGWDAKNLYVAAKVTDDKVFNNCDPKGSIYLGDQMMLRLGESTKILLAPTSATGKPACTLEGAGVDGIKAVAEKDDSGICWATQSRDHGYILELAIPFSVIGKKEPVKADDTIPYVFVVYDRDTDNPDEWKQTHIRISSSSIKGKPDTWPCLKFIPGITTALTSPVRIIGRTGLSSNGNPILYWSGSSVQARFEGTSITVVLNDRKGVSFYNAIIDGKDDAPVIVDTEPGVKRYPIATGLKPGDHEILLFKRTEGTDGPSIFLGFVLDDGSKLLAPPKAPDRRIEFYGDSITCGMGNEAPDKGDESANSDRNNYLAYGAITCRELNAEYRCIGRSGIGIIKSWYDLIMPDYWYRINPDDPNSRNDFTKWTPDVVVVNLFQNDKWLIKKLNPVPGEKEIVEAYVKFISGIRKVYPKAHIVCSLGTMDAAKEGSVWPGYVKKAMAEMNDKNMSFLLFPNKDWNRHPRVRHHRKMADLLVAHLKKVMDWK